MKESKAKTLHVGGDKKITAEQKVGEEGYFQDKFGNTIYVTDSVANQERLEALEKPKKAKKPAKKKAVAKKSPAKRGRKKKA